MDAFQVSWKPSTPAVDAFQVRWKSSTAAVDAFGVRWKSPTPAVDGFQVRWKLPTAAADGFQAGSKSSTQAVDGFPLRWDSSTPAVAEVPVSWRSATSAAAGVPGESEEVYSRVRKWGVFATPAEPDQPAPEVTQRMTLPGPSRGLGAARALGLSNRARIRGRTNPLQRRCRPPDRSSCSS